MKLTALKLCNFRAYRNLTELSFRDLTCIVGRNDSGKSSLLEALELFFSEKNPEAADYSVASPGDSIEITCVFSGLPDLIVIDDSNPTNLASEYLLNADGLLEVVKRFKPGGGKGAASTSLRAHHPSTEGCSDLMGLTIADLKKRAKAMAVDLSAVNQSRSAEIRQAIWRHHADLQLAVRLVPVEDCKDVWDRLKSHLPLFVLFKSDRASTDQDAEAQDPMKAAIAEAIKETQADLDGLVQKVQQEVMKVAELTLSKLTEMAPGLANTIRPRFDKQKWDSVFKVSLESDDGVPMNKRGSGVRRLILINFFRAKAELRREQEGKTAVIYAIEEPETSQHPANQRILLAALRDLSSRGEEQVIFTTHTPMLASLVDARDLRHIQVVNNKRTIAVADSEEAKRAIAVDLGVLADNSVKAFICVEGRNDIDFLQNLCDVLLADGVSEVPNLRKLEALGEIVFVPLGGGNLALWSSRLQRLNRREFHLYDRDEGDQQSAHSAAASAVNKRPGCKAVITTKRESENYLHPDTIQEVMDGIRIQVDAETDVPLAIAMAQVAAACSRDSKAKPWDQQSADKKEKRVAKIKRDLNTKAAAKMSKARLQIVDPTGEVMGWFRSISELLADHDRHGPVVNSNYRS